ncbi:50S ribosomal protein L28 [Amycolatopsis sp. NPDC050768]|uniref:50S ribosomal protein L28 n=1 Tax=Amycolatopsis sp. NPDC050768 TaxID=3154839 RepID=UPI00340401D7
MSAVCQVTGRKPGYGKQVSHSHRRTSRRWEPNLQTRRYYVPSLGRTVRLKVSAKGMKTIDKRAIDAVVAELAAKGVKL